MFSQWTDEDFIETEPFLAAMMNVRMILGAKRRQFYPDKNFGSRIKMAEDGPLSDPQVLAYAREAVSDIDGVYVLKAAKSGRIYRIGLIINGREGTVNVKV